MWHAVFAMMQIAEQTESCMQNQLSYYSLCVHVCVFACVCTTARCTVFVSCLALQGTLTMLPLSLQRLICLQFLTVVWNR